ncbi:MAG: dihydrofolate reductase [Lewinella sp.]|nr:dihydrofolate reductase [Lewinella sp.]
MDKQNSVFIATSLDGYIADRHGGLDWLHAIPNPEQDDAGYGAFMEGIDALLMGRKTFDTVLGFGIDWPYAKPVFVLSNSLTELPAGLPANVHLIKGDLRDVLARIHAQGYGRLYIDGGGTIQHFLREDLIDELIITTIPVLLGGGTPLFGALPAALDFELRNSQVFLGQMVQKHYRRKR